eukprot:CFRG0862T1
MTKKSKTKSCQASPVVSYIVTPPEEDEKKERADQKIMRTQMKVDEVVEIMKDNVEKVLERDEKMSNLETASENLNSRSRNFKKTSTQVKVMHRNRYWKWVLLVVLICFVFAAIIVCILKPWK